MDRRERFKDPIVAVRAMMEGRLANLWTAMPGQVISYNAEQQTVVVQPTIQGQQLSPQGVWSNFTFKPCSDCPVIFPSGGGFTTTFPIAAGDEGVLIFASRCIDAWWQNGGVQPQADIRMHDPSDGFFIPGARSQPNKLANVSTNSVQLRSADGTVKLDVGASKITSTAGNSSVTVDSAGDTEINPPVGKKTAVSGDLDATGSIAATAALSGASINIPGSAAANSSNPLLTAAGGVALTAGFTEVPPATIVPTNGQTVTVNPSAGLKQNLTNNVAGFTIAATAEIGDLELHVTNGASAGVLTFSGFKQWPGDVLDTTNGHEFVVFIFGYGAKAAYTIKALQ